MELEEDRIMLTPATGESTAARRATSLFSTVVAEIRKDPAERAQELPTPGEPPAVPEPAATHASESPEA